MRIGLTTITKADCKGCGACCRHMGHPTFIRTVGTSWKGYPRTKDDDIWNNMPRRLQAEVSAYLDGRKGDDYGLPCIWLTPEGTCKNYQHRPEVCRDFEPGNDACLEFRKEHLGLFA